MNHCFPFKQKEIENRSHFPMKELNHNNNKNDCPNKELTKAILYIEELEK